MDALFSRGYIRSSRAVRNFHSESVASATMKIIGTVEHADSAENLTLAYVDVYMPTITADFSTR
jgi:hypothetical protein